MNSYIEVNHLSKAYGQGHARRVVLDNCSFKIESEKLTALIGRSGSGKTTLLQILGGLMESDSGQIIVDGAELDMKTDTDRSDFRAEKVGFIFQNYELLPDYTVSENIRFVCDLQGKPFHAARYRALLEALRLEGLEDHYPEELSGGEQQRVAIARALYGEPAIVLADEPTGNLDSRSADEVFSLLLKCSRQFGQTIVMVTHDLTLAKQADAVLVIEDGKVRAYA